MVDVTKSTPQSICTITHLCFCLLSLSAAVFLGVKGPAASLSAGLLGALSLAGFVETMGAFERTFIICSHIPSFCVTTCDAALVLSSCQDVKANSDHSRMSNYALQPLLYLSPHGSCCNVL